ncbi:hypothetical protein KIN20_018552 [Parelaphostrongylus tenuis]|uniref:Uncharacterized protein n=1 Tax=Parelaphostrongylus tenuis TaxID=148309 RepID=A0AAD5QRI0_PARTN|nr:hypothetical protein KIN20_018552 [Parelaphostrongylus tenuis]
MGQLQLNPNGYTCSHSETIPPIIVEIFITCESMVHSTDSPYVYPRQLLYPSRQQTTTSLQNTGCHYRPLFAIDPPGFSSDRSTTPLALN